MKIGLSSYSLVAALNAGKLNLEQAIDWAAKQGAEVFELVPFGFRLDDETSGKIDTAYIARIKKRAQDAGIELVNYSVGGDLIKEGQAQEDEIASICHQVDIAAELGLTRMRHDITFFNRPAEENTSKTFDELLPRMVEATKRISEYAKTRGVMTMIENHGLFVNGTDRVERILNAVDTGNYGLLLDSGNIICVDEDPTAAALRLAKRSEMVHLKDFYVRSEFPGSQGWFTSRGGKYLRGSILGHGDLDVKAALRALKKADYTGNLAIEFEGMEESMMASAISLENAKRMLAEA